MDFLQKVNAASDSRNTLLCIGLDPLLSLFPQQLLERAHPIFEFNRQIIDATADLVCAYKPQAAHYHAVGAEEELLLTIQYINQHYPDIPVILDAKRGDIGSTAEQYAREAFERYRADAVTVNPYMGFDTIEPFIRHREKGTVVLCRTSNPSAGSIQNLQVGDRALYQVIADKACNEWNQNNNVLLVMGATHPDELGQIRTIVGDMTLLVPGLGAQGGDIGQTVRNGLNRNGAGMIINSSRGIIYAGRGDSFAEAARGAAKSLRDEINRYRP